MKTILVTGGAGYIGSHTCKYLSQMGYLPIVLDDLSTGYESFVKWGPLEKGSLLETHFLEKVFQRYRPLAVIHFAASAYVGESVKNPFKYYQNNVGGTLSLLSAMRATNINKIVFSSTCATYGTPDVVRIDEDCRQIPINPYGQSKLMIEKILYDIENVGDLKFMSLRYFNAAGDDPECEIGERHDPETHLIPLAIRSGYTGEELQIFGSDFPTPDGSAVRDYIHVNDLAGAHLSALEYLIGGGISSAINLGTGTGTSVKQIIGALNELGINITTKESPRRVGDPAFLVANPEKAKKILGWEAHYKDVKEILKTAIKWHQADGMRSSADHF